MQPRLPDTKLPGAIPTMNGRGFMLEALDDYATEFVEVAGRSGGEVLDIGCAYGVATLAALDQGAKVCACDMEARHLELVTERARPEQRARLRTVEGLLPDVDFEANAFSAILASRVIHFLTGDDIRTTLNKMAKWLRPGGYLFLVNDTPYMPGWDTIVPAYEKAKAAGDLWPGFIADFKSTTKRNTVADSGGPQYLNTLDPGIMARECERVGLQVQRSSFFGLQRLGDKSNRREHAGCVARKLV
jgi:SAM-dependent methyltransferase